MTNPMVEEKKIFRFFRFFGLRMTQFEKKMKKKFFDFFSCAGVFLAVRAFFGENAP